MDKNELVNKIRGIEGLTNDEKSALIEMLRKQKKYGLVWEDKPEDVEERLREELPMLIEDTDKAIISTDTDAPNHILIEGDNLEALTALAYTHEGNIDVIYIDPPYNTGNKDFVYNDKFVDSEDSYRHSKWLSFMNKRLRIAKGEFYQFNLSSCIRQQNSLTAQFVSFSLANLANIFYPPPPIFTIINLCLL